MVGGLGSIPGAVVGALTVGIAEELSPAVPARPTYRSAVGFLAILLVLTFRPRGILGQRAYCRTMEKLPDRDGGLRRHLALMALGLNLVWGMAGMINLGLVGFFAVGAYVSALLT